MAGLAYIVVFSLEVLVGFLCAAILTVGMNADPIWGT